MKMKKQLPIINASHFAKALRDRQLSMRPMGKKLKAYFLTPVINRLELQLLAIFFLSFGFFFSLFIVGSDILPKIFASTSWTQTDWSGGVGSSTSTQYSAGSNIDATTTGGQVTLAAASGWCNNASCNSSWKYRTKNYI